VHFACAEGQRAELRIFLSRRSPIYFSRHFRQLASDIICGHFRIYAESSITRHFLNGFTHTTLDADLFLYDITTPY